MKYYKFASVIMAGLCLFTQMNKFGGRQKNLNIIMYENAAGVVIMTTYIIFAIFSCAYSYRLTTRPGLSSSLRKDFIWRHICYVLIYISVWLPYLGVTFYIVYVC